MQTRNAELERLLAAAKTELSTLQVRLAMLGCALPLPPSSCAAHAGVLGRLLHALCQWLADNCTQQYPVGCCLIAHAWVGLITRACWCCWCPHDSTFACRPSTRRRSVLQQRWRRHRLSWPRCASGSWSRRQQVRAARAGTSCFSHLHRLRCAALNQIEFAWGFAFACLLLLHVVALRGWRGALAWLHASCTAAL